MESATDCSGVFLWNTTKSSEPRVVNLRMLKLRKKPPIKVKKTPAKARVLAVRESTISGRLQLPVYLHLWWKSNIIMPHHLTSRHLIGTFGGGGSSAASSGARQYGRSPSHRRTRFRSGRCLSIRNGRSLRPSRCSTAGRDAPVDYHALPVGRFLDGDQSEAFREPDGGTRLGPSDVGALSDPCHRE